MNGKNSIIVPNKALLTAEKQTLLTVAMHPLPRTYFVVTLLVGVVATAPAIDEPQTAVARSKESLSLDSYLQRVIERNRAIQSRLMGFHAARSIRRAEGGLFEPAFVASAEYVDRQRANTIEIERSLRSGGEFNERNQNYSSAVEFRTPLGSRVRVGAGARRLVNNIQRTVIVDLDAEYEANIGVSIEQPLLKNGGPTATYSALRLATRTAEAAYQDYRRQMMQTIAEAEIAYWQLHFAQEEYRLSRESAAMAEMMVTDGRTRFEAGRGSRLDVLEAEAGFAVRRSRESEARQKWVDAHNRLAGYIAVSPLESGVQFVAVDDPQSRIVDATFHQSSGPALAMSPDRLRARAVVEQEKVRVSFARNQRLPQVDLKASFGASGLGFDYSSAIDDIERARFPSWTIGIEMRIPIFGGIKERNELQAARQRMLQAELNARDVETQLTTGLDTARQRVDSSLAAVRNYTSVISFRKNLLDSQVESAQIGRTDMRTVLETEQELFAARLGQLQSEVEHQRALLELQIISGNLLQARQIDISMAALEKESARWARGRTEDLAILEYKAPTPETISSDEVIEFETAPDKPWLTNERSRVRLKQ